MSKDPERADEQTATQMQEVSDIDDIDLSVTHRCEGLRQLTARLTGSLSPAPADHPEKGPRFTPNIQALILTAVLFTAITLAQVAAANIANSQALLMDCISMGVDALTYMGNIIVECRKRDGKAHEGSQIIVCAISIGCLLYFTAKASQESLSTIHVCLGVVAGEQEPGDVNGYITLAFGVGGVVFDLISLWAFYNGHRKQGGGRAVNMFTALLHVGADFLRSTSTVVMSMLILFGNFDSTCLDAYTSILIGASIVAGALFGLVGWAKLVGQWGRKLVSQRRSLQPEQGP